MQTVFSIVTRSLFLVTLDSKKKKLTLKSIESKVKVTLSKD